MTSAAVGREDLAVNSRWFEHSRLERWKACSVLIR